MLTFKPWKVESVLQLLLGLFGGMALAGFLAAGLGYQPVPGQVDYVMMIVGALSFHGVGLLWLSWFVRDHELTWPAALGLELRSFPRVLIMGLLVGVAGFYVCLYTSAFVIEVMGHFQVEPEMQSTVKALQSTMSPAWAVVFAIVSIVLAPIVEEFIFRGVIFTMLKQLGFPLLAWWGTSLAFAATHANLQAFLPLTILALMLTWLYNRTDNLMAPILAHGTFNAINFALTIQHGALSSAGATQ